MQEETQDETSGTAESDDKNEDRLLSASSATVLRRKLCIFSLSYLVVYIGFFFTRSIKVGNIRLQDILTMINPLILVPYFYSVALVDENHEVASRPPPKHQVLFLLCTIIYVHGDGMHLAANAIHRYDEEIESEDALDVIELYDEELGHYYPYIGLMLLHIIWLVRQSMWPFERKEDLSFCRQHWSVILCGLIHGFSLFINFVEGRFAIPGIIFFVTLLAFLIVRRNRLRHDPIHLFTICFAGAGLLLFVIWGIWQKGFPELTDAGVI